MHKTNIHEAVLKIKHYYKLNTSVCQFRWNRDRHLLAHSHRKGALTFYRFVENKSMELPSKGTRPISQSDISGFLRCADYVTKIVEKPTNSQTSFR